MSIIVSCKNGHRLSAPDKRAGTVGHCPSCGVDVLIPEPSPNSIPSESSIMRILGIGKELRKNINDFDREEEAKRNAEGEGKEIKKRTERTKKICPKCRYYFIR